MIILIPILKKNFQRPTKSFFTIALEVIIAYMSKGEEQLAAWRLLTPVLNKWKAQANEKVPNYTAGTWGPTAADQMLHENGHQWQLLENDSTEAKTNVVNN